MDRTYNVFVDNGLFVLADYINKDIEEVDEINDITNDNTTKYFANRVASMITNTGKYQKITNGSFGNSCYVQSGKKEQTKEELIYETYKIFIDYIKENLEGDTCSICGKHKVPKYKKEHLGKITKSYFPRLCTNTFFNFSNNLKQVNICPVCFYLSLLGFINIKATLNQCILFISDNDEFMYDYTYEHKLEIDNDILTNAKEYIKDKNNTKSIRGEISNLIIDKINNNKIYDGYIEIVKFYNSSQDESYEIDILNKKDTEFLKRLQSLFILSEFREKGFMYNLIEGNFQKNYLKYVFNFNEGKFKVSRDLLELAEEVYSKLSKEKIQLIKQITKKVYDNEGKKSINDIKSIDKIRKIKDVFTDWLDKKYMTINDYDILENDKQLYDIKQRIYVELISLKNESEEI